MMKWNLDVFAITENGKDYVRCSFLNFATYGKAQSKYNKMKSQDKDFCGEMYDTEI